VLGSELQVASSAHGRWRLRLLPAVTLWSLALLVPALPAAAQSADAVFMTALGELPDAGFADKEAIVARLADTGHPSTAAVLTAMLEDRLYVRASDRRVVITTSADDGQPALALIDPLTLRSAGSSPVVDLVKIGTNNRLRRVLRTTAARFALANPDAEVRHAAVTDMLRSLDDATADLLRQRLPQEPDAAVKREIEGALAMMALGDADPAARLAAVRALSSRRSADVRNRLAVLLERDAEGTATEPDAQVRAAARAVVDRIDLVRSVYSGVETLFFGLSLGSVLVLAAIGLAITFGVMGVINMAHGELMMLGAYTTYVVQTLMPDHLDWALPLSIPAAFVVAGLAGVTLERTIIRFLYGRPLETLLATYGVSLVLQQLVRSVFTANNRAVSTPSWMSGTWQVNEALAVTLNRIYIVGFTLVVFGLLLLVLRRTRLGLQIRAVSQNRGMARAMGIRSARVDALTFGLGAGIAGVAGVALSQLTNVGPNLGQAYIIDSFMVVVFGGVGNLWGTLIGGMALGMINKLLEPFAGAVLGKIAVLVTLILFIQRRPRGLFPQTGRAAEGA
jgi:urea transport system permease protein